MSHSHFSWYLCESGLIRWRIVFHGFVDGYSRLITGLRASNNNRASTVLDVFLGGVQQYGVPSRVRGDHGTENLLVAEYMERFRGIFRGSYIWGRSVGISKSVEPVNQQKYLTILLGVYITYGSNVSG